MEGDGAATTKIQRTNGSANNSQPANKAGTNTSQNPRPRNTNNRSQQYQQKDGNKPPNFEAGARKNPANPRRGKKFNRGKAQGQQTQQGQQVQQVQQGQQSQQGQQAHIQDQVHVHAAQTQAQEHIQAAQLRAPSWSNIVSHHTCEPFVSEHNNGYEARSEVVLQSVSPQPAERQVHVQVPQTHFQQSTDSQNPRHRAKGQKKVAQEYASKEEETDYNADAKIEAMQIALDKRLNAMQSKTERIKTLQEEILKIRAERDVKIEELLNEKAGLTGRLQQLRIELRDTDSQISKLDLNVAQLKQEKVQKIRALEGESHALLDDKSN